MHSRLASLLTAAAFLSACDATRPDDGGTGAGITFDLRSVDGQPLPTPWRLSAEPRVVVRASIVLADWTTTVENGAAEWRLTLRAPDGTESEMRTTRSYFRRDELVGFDTCPPPFQCASILLPHSHAVVNGSLLEFPSENGWQALVYGQR